MTARAENRSVIAPPTSTSTPAGMVTASITTPSAAGDPVTDSTSHAKTTA
jgi:hypothetical protein